MALGLGGTIAGGITSVYYLTKKKEKQEDTPPLKPKEKTKITDLLKQKELVLLKEGEDNDALNEKWKTFKGEYESQQLRNNWEIANLTSKDENTAPQEFKKLCNDNSEKEVDDEKDSIFTQLVKYCTKSKAGVASG